MPVFRAELHVHTVLSPCAGVEMIPPLIVEKALSSGIDLLAITDHNASANIEAVITAARATRLKVLPGMELQTREEVHLLCLFDTMEQVNAWQKQVDARLPELTNNIEYFGEQFVVDSNGEFIRREERLLLNSVNLEIETATRQVKELGGLAIPAHVDRKANGLLEILGFVPPGFEALELSRHISPPELYKKYPQLKNFALIQSGDVHYLNDFLGSTYFTLQEPNISEIRLAINGNNGRKLHLASLDNLHRSL